MHFCLCGLCWQVTALGDRPSAGRSQMLWSLIWGYRLVHALQPASSSAVARLGMCAASEHQAKAELRLSSESQHTPLWQREMGMEVVVVTAVGMI